MLELRPESFRHARMIRVGDSVRYWSGSGKPYVARVAAIPEEGQVHGYPPTIALEFRDEINRRILRPRVLHTSRSYSRRMVWEMPWL